ncbi:CLUMA_CG003768, isoform A [Clunio marinus]|uniref:CLUMA_CG003768, isoform A n=1 Tax=Clunio marinus TaxID=568069 RepID=A0A1J1HPZ7_9DIPT|nr:CLUMA_CG003768, isoform A [Clunio marinus]
MEKVKRFLKVQTDPCEHRTRQQVQVHPQVGRRRRKSRARRDGRLSGASGHSTRNEGQFTGQGSIVNINPQMPAMTQPETLRQKAFAKLKLFNFSLNWDLHMNQCRPRSLLSRRLYRSRKYDDNELYRSNSFRFQRFERNDDTCKRFNKQVSLACSSIASDGHSTAKRMNSVITSNYLI